MSDHGRSARGRLRVHPQRQAARARIEAQASSPERPNQPGRHDANEPERGGVRTNPSAAVYRPTPACAEIARTNPSRAGMRTNPGVVRNQTNPSRAQSDRTRARVGIGAVRIPNEPGAAWRSKRTRGSVSRSKRTRGRGPAARTGLDTIVASVRRINRLIAVHAGWKFGGLRWVGDLSNGRCRLEMLHRRLEMLRCNVKVL